MLEIWDLYIKKDLRAARGALFSRIPFEIILRFSSKISLVRIAKDDSRKESSKFEKKKEFSVKVTDTLGKSPHFWRWCMKFEKTEHCAPLFPTFEKQIFFKESIILSWGWIALILKVTCIKIVLPLPLKILLSYTSWWSLSFSSGRSKSLVTEILIFKFRSQFGCLCKVSFYKKILILGFPKSNLRVKFHNSRTFTLICQWQSEA